MIAYQSMAAALAASRIGRWFEFTGVVDGVTRYGYGSALHAEEYAGFFTPALAWRQIQPDSTMQVVNLEWAVHEERAERACSTCGDPACYYSDAGDYPSMGGRLCLGGRHHDDAS